MTTTNATNATNQAEPAGPGPDCGEPTVYLCDIEVYAHDDANTTCWLHQRDWKSLYYGHTSPAGWDRRQSK